MSKRKIVVTQYVIQYTNEHGETRYWLSEAHENGMFQWTTDLAKAAFYHSKDYASTALDEAQRSHSAGFVHFGTVKTTWEFI